MKIPKRLKDLLDQKQAFIDSQRDQLSNTMVKLQSDLFSNILSDIIPELDVKDGLILDTPKNYKLISLLDKTYKDFNVSSTKILAEQVAGTVSLIVDYNTKYYNSVLGVLSERFTKILAETKNLIDLKIGLTGDKVFKGGWLDSYFTASPVGTELKQIVSQAVTSNMNKKELIKILKSKITGTKDYTGTLERQFNMYAYDLYQQYDAAYNLTIGNEFGFNYFIYLGGLIDDSRDFCAAHNGKVWSKEEALTWKDWVPADGEYPEGWKVKQKDQYSHPGYMDVPGYDPFINRGGYHCRHKLGWIADELALKRRPELTKN